MFAPEPYRSLLVQLWEVEASRIEHAARLCFLDSFAGTAESEVLLEDDQALKERILRRGWDVFREDGTVTAWPSR